MKFLKKIRKNYKKINRIIKGYVLKNKKKKIKIIKAKHNLLRMPVYFYLRYLLVRCLK